MSAICAVAAPAILVLTGASGAGKSTLVRGLAALALPGIGCYELDTIGIPTEAEIAVASAVARASRRGRSRRGSCV